jgi:molybdopterin converting factor small subunit
MSAVTVVFARAFRRHVDCPDAQVTGATIGEVLDEYFASHPATRTYVVDDTGGVRRHVALFLNDEAITDRITLTDPVADGDRVHIFQALSGG